MKKNYSLTMGRVGVALCALLMVACGLRITKVTLSDKEIPQSGEVTVTTQYERNDSDYDNNKDIYLLYAIRVPQDWTYAKAVEATSVVYNGNDSTVANFTFEESNPYATLAEFCFPKDGYKWIGFQTTKQVTLTCEINGKDNVKAAVTLKSGNEMGTFNLDIISGSFPRDPSLLLNADGTVNIDNAFGRKSDFNKADAKTLSDGTQVFGFSEYLVNASTISPAERAATENALISYKATVDGVTLPISAGVDVGNDLTDEELAGMELTVTVVEGNTTAIEDITVSADDENAPIYNLHGVKVTNPTVPGIYIKNGKKFVVK